jgi:hypothetical protein
MDILDANPGRREKPATSCLRGTTLSETEWKIWRLILLTKFSLGSLIRLRFEGVNGECLIACSTGPADTRIQMLRRVWQGSHGWTWRTVYLPANFLQKLGYWFTDVIPVSNWASWTYIGLQIKRVLVLLGSLHQSCVTPYWTARFCRRKLHRNPSVGLEVIMRTHA